MNEGKRGFKNKKHVVSMDKVKQRNPVAKNSTAGIGGGAAGAHDAKKHTRKEKHKKTPADMMEGAEYSRSLELKLQIALVESAIMERDPAAYAAAARRSIFQNIGAGAMRDPSDPVRVKADRAIANRERGLERQRARFDARQAAQPAAPAPDVEKMKATLAKLEIEFDKLGGDSYQYADRMTDRDIEARDIHRRILSLRGAIERAEQGVAEGQGDFSKAIDNLHGWYQVNSNNPDVEIYEFDDREGGFYADGTVYHNTKTGRVKIEFEDKMGEYGGMNVNDTFNSIGDAMNVLRQITIPIRQNTGKAQNFDRLGGREVAGPNDVYKTDRAGKKGTLTKSRMDTMKMSSPYRKTGPKGVLPEQGVAEARANTASARASLERRKTKAPLTPEEQRAKDAAKFEKWKAKNQKPEKVAENDLRNPKLVWGPGVRNEVDPEGRSTKFVPKTGTYRVHTGAVGPDQVKQDIKQRIKKGGIAGPKHRLPKE